MKLDPVTETLLNKLQEEEDMDDPNPLNHPVVKAARKVAKRVLSAQAERPVRIGGSVK